MDPHPTQGQVAALVAAGATNAEIASALGISEKTVDKHMTIIKERTGLSTRTSVVTLFRTAIAPAGGASPTPADRSGPAA